MHKYLALAGSSLLALAACGGGGGYSSSGGGGGGIAGPGPNVATLTVQTVVPGFVNIPYISVTVCQPGSAANCQTFDNIEVDTGSWGLRIIADPAALSAAQLALLSTLTQQNQQMVPGTTTPVVECAQFADGYSWGPVVSADVSVSSEKASGIPIQVIGSSAFTQVPQDCSSPVPNPENTVATFGANGIIGVGVFLQDCGSACASAVQAGTYYQCPTSGAACTGIVEATDLQVSNPVGFFAADNNGVIVELPSEPAGGAATATGALVFGIGTQSNNSLGGATILATDSGSGTVTVNFGGVPYPLSALDSGSNALFFTDNSLAVCGQNTAGQGYYCASANLSASIATASNTLLAANFTVGDATSMFSSNPNAAVFPQLAAPIGAAQSQTFDFGLPYFYGRNVFNAIETRNAGGTMGPYFAY